MTLSPFLGAEIVGVPGGLYRVGPRCCVPGCPMISEHAHHLWRRSKTAGPHSWVEIRLPGQEPVVVGNLAGLCVEHHHAVTVHDNWIKWIDGVFYWGDNVAEDPAFPVFREIAPLDPQPPTPERLDVSQPATETESEVCPTCGQHKRRRSPSPSPEGEPRPRKSWVVKVPADSEDGAAILDAFVDDLAPVLGFDPAASARYFVINAAFVYVEQDRHAFIEAVAGIGGKEHSHA